jgi:hypothetical protein
VIERNKSCADKKMARSETRRLRLAAAEEIVGARQNQATMQLATQELHELRGEASEQVRGREWHTTDRLDRSGSARPGHWSDRWARIFKGCC